MKCTKQLHSLSVYLPKVTELVRAVERSALITRETVQYRPMVFANCLSVEMTILLVC